MLISHQKVHGATAVVILLVASLSAPFVVSAQRRAQAGEFTVTAYIFALKIPIPMVANADGTPIVSGPNVWMAIKNTTTIPYFLCMTGSGWTSPSLGGAVGGIADSCSPAWLVLPGETHFQAVGAPIPNTHDERWTVSIAVMGKPLGAIGNLTNWNLSWTGTAGEAAALGEQMEAKIP